MYVYTFQSNSYLLGKLCQIVLDLGLLDLILLNQNTIILVDILDNIPL